VDDLNAFLEVPRSLSELGIKNPDIDRIVSSALNDPSTAGNPINMTINNTRDLVLNII